METATFHVKTMRAASSGGFSTATDVADYLVRRGLPFREAHEVVGKVVQVCESQNKQLEELALYEWQNIDERFDNRVLDCVKVEDSVSARDSYGGKSPSRVREQLDNAKKLMEESRA
jgi:argininosuccinate lyase